MLAEPKDVGGSIRNAESTGPGIYLPDILKQSPYEKIHYLSDKKSVFFAQIRH